jgi:hypothetical protein
MQSENRFYSVGYVVIDFRTGLVNRRLHETNVYYVWYKVLLFSSGLAYSDDAVYWERHVMKAVLTENSIWLG